MENVVESDGDRFADVVENAKLNESVAHVLSYVKKIVNDNSIPSHIRSAEECLKFLEVIQKNTADCIGNAIA